MKKLLFGLIVCLTPVFSAAQDIDAYRIFSSKGEPVTFSEMVTTLSGSDVLLFGEYHNNPIAHWMELEVTRALYSSRKGKVVLGAEMFEADNQLIMDEYLAGIITTKRFEAEMRLWKNYRTDYKPLVEFAREHSLPFIATNVPRRYASAVAKGGFEALDAFSAEAKRYIAPLPIPYDPTLPGYSAMVSMGAMRGGKGGDNLPKAQAIKDATMAYFILLNSVGDVLFIHYNGAYHSNNREGIVWYLLKTRPNLKVATVTTVTQTDVSRLEKDNHGLADFILVVPASMTTTY